MSRALVTTPVHFGSDTIEEIMSVAGGMPAHEAVELARSLAGGISQICQRMHSALDDGDPIYCDEIRSIEFLGKVVGALTQSVGSSLEGGDQ